MENYRLRSRPVAFWGISVQIETTQVRSPKILTNKNIQLISYITIFPSSEAVAYCSCNRWGSSVARCFVLRTMGVSVLCTTERSLPKVKVFPTQMLQEAS